MNARTMGKGLLVCVALGLGACTGSLFESKQAIPQIYLLKPVVAAGGSTAAKFTASLSIATPTATPGLDTDRIALVRDGTQLDFYRSVRWGGTAPRVAQTFLLALLQDAAGFAQVTAEQARVDSDYLLDLELRDFQAEYRGAAAAPTVHVTLVANLVRVQTRKSLGLLQATATVPATTNTMTAVVTAFQQAAQQTSESLARQLREALSNERT